MAKNQKLDSSDYEKIGRTMESIVLYGYANKTRLFWTNFLRGIFVGMGSALGATVVIALLLFALSLFSEIPLLGRFFENLQDTLESSQNIR